jgi:frataxin
MSRTSVSKLARATARSLTQRQSLTTAPRALSRQTARQQAPRILSVTSARPFSSTPIVPKGISPESENPQPTPKEPIAGGPQATGISAAEYEELSNEYMDRIVEKLEQLQEEKDSMDVEYSVRTPNVR